jgi:hypothetical protein
MQVQFEGKTYEVSFTGQWHNPPLPGTIHPSRIKHTTTCEIRLPEPKADTVAVTGEAHCSVMDRFNYMGGCRRALDRAVFELLSMDQGDDLRGDTLDEAQAVFERQVMPVLAEQQKERRATIPKRRKGPGRRLLGHTVNELAERTAMALVALQHGTDAAVYNYTAVKVRNVASREETRKRAEEARATRTGVH